MRIFLIPRHLRERFLALLLIAGLTLSAASCGPKPESREAAQPAAQAQQSPSSQPTQQNGESVQRYELNGRVVDVDRDKKLLTVAHHTIPGLMFAMTMAFPVKDARLLEGLQPGDEITADVLVHGEDLWLENIVVTKSATSMNDGK